MQSWGGSFSDGKKTDVLDFGNGIYQAKKEENGRS